MTAPKTNPERLLIIDDDRQLAESLTDWLGSQGFVVTQVTTAKEAIKCLKSETYDLVLCDWRLDDGDGLDVLKVHRSLKCDFPFVMMSGYATPDFSAEVVAAGAFDLLTKPIIDQELMHGLRRALDQQRVAAENGRLKAELDRRVGLENVISHDIRMQRIFETIDSVADARANILITGENGTGKSMIARAIHKRSDRRNGPFVEVACGSLPDNLLESELFGHTAGSFTGALGTKIGKFELANGGTLFLDEIGTSSPAMQVKLLRVVQELEFERLGGTETISVDTRVVFATNELLEEAVAAGTFRQDLFYRINVIRLELPSLRERFSDIPLLVEHFLQKSSTEFGRKIEGFTPEAMQLLQTHSWPGNIRELENIVQRAVLLTKSDWIDVPALPPQLQTQHNVTGSHGSQPLYLPGQTLREALDQPERQIILDVLRINSWNRNETAEQLGINRTTLYKKMKRLHLDELCPG
jgi:DNA-binding NtrC family response regulator